MSTLAIKGHSTRGSEVIALLEMLGGENRFQREGNNKDRFYYIDTNQHIQTTCGALSYTLFDIEEFKEKFPYKVGDKVIHNMGILMNVVYMCWDAECNVIRYDIQSPVDNNYKFKAMLAEHLQPYKEQETKEKVNYCQMGKITVVCIGSANYENKVEIMLDNYEIKEENGKYYAVKKKPKYPSSYEECCDILQLEHTFDLNNLTIDEERLIKSFVQLKRCRDAYWKITGEQMGLGKPWEPDWNVVCGKYTIYTVYGNEIWRDTGQTINTILAFPTREIRNAFYENFKDLIEQCKELL